MVHSADLWLWLKLFGRPRFPGPLLRRTRGPDPSSKATLWVKAQHEGALLPPCIVRKDPRYDGDLSLPLGLALGSPIFPSGCEGKLGVALESLQGLRDLT